MTYKVKVSKTSAADIERQVRYIAEVRLEPVSALRWRQGILSVIDGLSEFPRSHPVAPESEGLDADIRGAVFLSHRILFGVDDEAQTVTVYRVVHGASIVRDRELDAE